jgi:hypothetical protein
MSKALNVAELNKRIDDLNKSAQKMGDDYQDVGVMCLQHLLDHGDVGPINRLILGMPKSTRRLAMATWAVAHGALVPNTDQGTRDTMPLRYTKEKKTDVKAAAAMKWWEAAPERNISDVFDLQVAVKQLLARAKGKKLQIGGQDRPHEGLAILNMLATGVGLAVEAPKVDKPATDGDVAPGTDAGPATTAEGQVNADAAKDLAAAAVSAASTKAKERAVAKAKGDKPSTRRAATKGGRARANA